MKLLLKKCHKEYILVTLLIIILYLFTYIPIVGNFLRAPADRYYWGSTEYPIDQMGNLTNIQEGYLGHWLRFPKVTSTIEGKPSLIKFEYILIGQMARLTHIDPLAMYYLTRIIISITTLLFIYVLVKSIYQTTLERLVSYLLALFATSVSLPFAWSKEIVTNLPVDVGVLSRLTNSTHHYLLGILLSLASYFFLAKAIATERKIRYLLIASLFGMLTSLIFAPGAVLIILSLPFFLLVLSLRKFISGAKMASVLFPTGIIFIYILVTVIPMIYYRYISQFWEFNLLTKIEKIVPFNPLPGHYFYIVGITYILSILAIPYVLKKGNTILLMFLPWIVTHPLAVYFLAPFLGLNKTRFFLTGYFVVFAILATAGISYLCEIIGHFLKSKNIKIYTSVAMVVITLASGILTYKFIFNVMELCFCLVGENFTYGYPKKEVMDAIFWLRDNTSEDEIVLSGSYAGMLIPAFAGNKVYTSWWHQLLGPPNLGETYQAAFRFYSGSMSIEETRLFLKNYKIAYVFFGSEERQEWSSGKELRYPFLKLVKQNRSTLLYRVNL